MFLKDLFQYRTTDKKENREDFLSACLAELMRQDPAACDVVVRTLKMEPPGGVQGLRIRTQVSFLVRDRVGNRVGRPDIVLEKGAWRGLIECKVGAPADLAQIALYRAIPGKPVVSFLALEEVVTALDQVAGKAHVPGTKDWIEWGDVRKASWTEVLTAVDQLPPPPSGVPAHGAHFRAAFIDLAEKLDIFPHRSPTVAEACRAAEAARELADLRPAFEAAVLALLPSKFGVSPLPVDDDDPALTWIETNAVGAHWAAEEAPPGLPFCGLGLEVHEREGVGEKEVDWVLSVYPTHGSKAKLRGMAANFGKEPGGEYAWEESEHWWDLRLSDQGEAGPTIGAQLKAAVTEVRELFAHSDIGLARREFHTPPGQEVASLIDNLALEVRFTKAKDHLVEQMWDRLKGTIHFRKNDGRYAKKRLGRLAIGTKKTEQCWIQAFFDPTPRPTLRLTLNWGPERNQKLRGLLSTCTVEPGLVRTFDVPAAGETKGRMVLTADLTTRTLESATLAMTTTVKRLFEDHAEAVLPPFRQLDPS